MLELGPGWTPAIADDPAELDLFYRQKKISTDDRHYWIGGLAYKTLQGKVTYTRGGLRMACLGASLEKDPPLLKGVTYTSKNITFQ